MAKDNLAPGLSSFTNTKILTVSSMEAPAIPEEEINADMQPLYRLLRDHFANIIEPLNSSIDHRLNGHLGFSLLYLTVRTTGRGLKELFEAYVRANEIALQEDFKYGSWSLTHHYSYEDGPIWMLRAEFHPDLNDFKEAENQCKQLLAMLYEGFLTRKIRREE
jgi:hypothetical protein